MSAVRAGDRERFREIVERNAPAVLALARAFLRDAQHAEDLAQDAFVAAYERLAQFDPARGRFRAWLLGIARNRCRDVLRRAGRRVPGAPLPRAVKPRAPGDVVLDGALAGLPPEQRVAFVLVHVFEMTLADVARIEGVPVGTVKSRASRARSRLRAALPALAKEHRHD